MNMRRCAALRCGRNQFQNLLAQSLIVLRNQLLHVARPTAIRGCQVDDLGIAHDDTDEAAALLLESPQLEWRRAGRSRNANLTASQHENSDPRSGPYPHHAHDLPDVIAMSPKYGGRSWSCTVAAYSLPPGEPSTMKHSSLLRAALPASIVALLGALSACSKQETAALQDPVASTAPAAEDPLLVSVNSESRSADDKARDQYRHPREALAFWGLQPGMTILEVQPGGGWWTEILAPYAHATGGKYYATAADLDNPELSEGARKARADFEAKLAAKPEVYGSVQLVNFGAKSKPMPENTFDFALSARSVHGWMGGGITDKVFKDLYGALKPGGILAIEQHRANPGEQDPKAESGYVTEAFVIEQAQKAGSRS